MTTNTRPRRGLQSRHLRFRLCKACQAAARPCASDFLKSVKQQPAALQASQPVKQQLAKKVSLIETFLETGRCLKFLVLNFSFAAVKAVLDARKGALEQQVE